MKNTIVNNMKKQIQKCIQNFTNKINKFRENRPNVSLLNNIKIDFCNKKIPISQISKIYIENFRTIVIEVFDKKNLSVIEKEIVSSLKIHPHSDGKVIKLFFSPLTKEDKKKITKLVDYELEIGKISIRNVRRISNEKIKILFNKKKISKDEQRIFLNKIQKITNDGILKINELSKIKKKTLNI